MNLTKPQLQEIIELLEPLMKDQRSRESLMEQLFFGNSNQPQIDLSGPPRDATFHIVTNLMDYGEIEPGKQALWELLDMAHSMVG